MFRARLAFVLVAASLLATGCNCFDHGCFGGCREQQRCPQPCDPCCRTAGAPYFDGHGLPPGAGPVLAPNGVPVGPGQVPINGQPRLVPMPQSNPSPYVPH